MPPAKVGDIEPSLYISATSVARSEGN